MRIPGALIGERNMAPKLVRSILIVPLIVTALSAVPSMPAYAADSVVGSSLPALDTFTLSVNNGQASQLRGVYVPNVLADIVVQQPDGQANFVSPRQGVITQFSAAASLGSTGLLAHNFLAGAEFPEIQAGQHVYLVYGDGHTAEFVVSLVHQYQALQPESPYSDFIDLSDGRAMNSGEVFSAAYGHPGGVVFQTCIAHNGEPSWGRLFIVAEPYVRPEVHSLIRTLHQH